MNPDLLDKMFLSGILNEDSNNWHVKKIEEYLDRHTQRRKRAQIGLLNILARQQDKSVVALLNVIQAYANKGKEAQVGLLNVLQARIVQLTPILIKISTCIDNYGIEDSFDEDMEYEVVAIRERTLVVVNMFGDQVEVYKHKFDEIMEVEL